MGTHNLHNPYLRDENIHLSWSWGPRAHVDSMDVSSQITSAPREKMRWISPSWRIMAATSKPRCEGSLETEFLVPPLIQKRQKTTNWTCMSQEISTWLVSGLWPQYIPFIGRFETHVLTFTNHLLTSWDIQFQEESRLYLQVFFGSWRFGSLKCCRRMSFSVGTFCFTKLPSTQPFFQLFNYFLISLEETQVLRLTFLAHVWLKTFFKQLQWHMCFITLGHVTLTFILTVQECTDVEGKGDVKVRRCKYQTAW